MDLIRIKHVEKKYKNGVTAIYDLNIAIEKGSFVFVIGGSGSGKSTLIKMLYREEKPTKGQIIVGGLDVAKLKDKKVYKLRRKLGIVFQDYRLLPKLTVYENVAFALEVIGAKKDEIREKVLKALEEVGLKNKVHNYPDQLSGGEQQRVAIARAIVNNPKLLLCDEPTGNLDPEKSMEIMKVLDNINKTRGTTIIMATHDKDIVNTMKKQVLILKEGRLVAFKEKGGYDDEAVQNDRA
ncbi:MAG: cell division ATP-binding protein FtsE [Tenericutes bacterium]|nr:cell division ATP-binding protein FtsE [Mycoplasmatota bacterium]